eukprot:scaffold320017_cov116-Cyclotella_meneghiniana.AAC.3
MSVKSQPWPNSSQSQFYIRRLHPFLVADPSSIQIRLRCHLRVVGVMIELKIEPRAHFGAHQPPENEEKREMEIDSGQRR